VIQASQTAEQVRSGRLKAVDIVGAAIEAALDSHDELNAFTLIDRSGAMTRAEGIDRLITEGKDPGPLAGVPIALKDIIDQAGLPNSRGASFPAQISEHSATVVRQLGVAGAVIIGRTGLHEFAFGFTSENPWFGPVRNPWDTTTSAGGSSGGSGAAVAAGIVPVAIGTDTGGSVRVPAALCGVFGLKVTHGRVPLTGVYPLVPSLDTVGPLARSVSDIDLVYNAVVGYDAADGWSVPVDAIPNVEIGQTTIGVVEQWSTAPMSGNVRAGIERFIAGAREAGFSVVSVDEPSLAPHPALGAAIGPEILEIHEERFEKHRDRYGKDLQARLDLAKDATARDVVEAWRWGTMARNTIARLHGDGVGILAAPSVGSMRKVIGEDDIDVDGVRHFHRTVLASFTSPINRIGVPALAAPISGGEGVSGEGVPVSVQLIAPMWHEASILDVARRLESAGVLSAGTPPLNLGSRFP